jgi:HK97 family phage portal protein
MSRLGGRNDADAQMRAMGGVGTLFAIVDRYASATAQVDWHLWARAASGRDEDRREITRHPALSVLHKPNDFYSSEELVETVQQHIDLIGEGVVVVVRDGTFNIPIELWPVRPDKLQPVTDPEEFISGYVYYSPDGEKVPLDVDEVIRIKQPCPWDPYRGLGAVQAILADLQSVQYAAEWNRNFFLNSAEPGGVIEVDEELDDVEFRRLRERWNEQHRGVSRAHRVAILEKGKWRDRNVSMKDMQFAELRNVSREVIREAFRAHKHMLGLADDVNRANAQAAEITFGRWEVLPRLKRWKTKLNGEFLPLFPDNSRYGIELDYDNPVPDDQELEAQLLTARADAASKLVTAGWQADGVLSAVGLPEIEYGGAPAAPEPAPPAIEPVALVRLPMADDTPRLALPRPPEQRGQADNPAPENAMRWVAVCEDDDESCQPCKDNDGQLYRNRGDAYADYPGGEGYVHCLGRGNCRCRVVKRRKGGE